MAMVDVDGSNLLADSQSKCLALVRGLAAIWRSVGIHQVNHIKYGSGYDYDDSTININVNIIIRSHRCT